jgi:hypothetical protein
VAPDIVNSHVLGLGGEMPLFGRRGPSPEEWGPIERRWKLLNDLRPLGEKSQLGKPYGTDDHLHEALRYVSVDLIGIDEVRESAEIFAVSLNLGIQRQAFGLYDMISVMGADERQQGADTLTAAETAQVYERGRAAHEFLRDFEHGPTWNLFQQRDDFARDVLVWLIVAIHRLGSAELIPVFPMQPPLP